MYEDGDDRGSSLSVYHKGKLVVDLRGGFANERELWPWQENTITRMFSVTKGLSAIVVGILVDRYEKRYVRNYRNFISISFKVKQFSLHDHLVCCCRGLLKYDDLVVKHWPEFGANGKEKVTVEMLLSHQVNIYNV